MISRPSVSYDDLWAKTLLESEEVEVWIELDPDFTSHRMTGARSLTLLFV